MAFAGRVDWRHGPLEAGQAERFAATLGFRDELQVDSLKGAFLIRRKKLNATDCGEMNAQLLPGNGNRPRLMFSGYLSNREYLVGTLQPGFDTRELPDSGYVRLALERWGTDAPAYLEGSFALAYWMPDKRQLLLSIDHIGYHPLYYHLGDGWLAFATTPMPILALPGVPILPDERRLANCLARVTDEPGRSFFAGIRRVPAASTALFSGSEPVIKRYWQPDFHRQLHYQRDDDYVEEARELLDRAVCAHLRNAGKVAFEISGGLDSSAIAATAARLLAPSPVNTLTALPAEGIVLPEWDKGHYLSEQPFVEAIARMHTNLHPTFLASSPTCLRAWEQDWTAIFRLTGAPITNPLNLAWFSPIYEYARAGGVSTIVTGLLGNQTLSRNGMSVLTSRARAGQWSWVLREARALSKSSGLSFARLFCGAALRVKLPVVWQTIDRLRRHAHLLWEIAPVNPEFAEAHNIPERMSQRRQEEMDGTEVYRRAQFEWTQDRADNIVPWRHIIGCDYRHPLTDRRLIEFCFAVPENQYLRNGVTRFLARRVLADRLPPEVINNTRRGIQSPDAVQRIGYQRNAIINGVEELEISSLACRILDVPRMKTMATCLLAADSAADSYEYRYMLYMGLHYGQFLRWVENGAV